jgi:hypothetical protein
MGSATAEDHQAIRERGALLAQGGPDQVASVVHTRLGRLRIRLLDTEPRTLVQVAGGAVMHLDDYLMTRIVEQAVHLDDLSRSIDRPLSPLPPAAYDAALSVALDLAQLRSDAPAVIRALYREGFADGVFPVL